MKRLALLVGLALTGCGSGQFSNPFLVPLTITLAPQNLDLVAGHVAHASFAISDGAQSVSAQVSITAKPSVLSVLLDDNTLYVSAPADANPGTYLIGLAASSLSGRGETTLAVNLTRDGSTPSPSPVPSPAPSPAPEPTPSPSPSPAPTPPAAPTYRVTATPNPLTLPRNSTGHISLLVDKDAGFTGDVKITGISGDTMSTKASADGALALNVTTHPGAYAGTYHYVVTTSGGGQTLETGLDVIVSVPESGSSTVNTPGRAERP